MESNFSKIEKRLLTLQPGRMKMGLDRAIAAAEALGSPHRAPGIRWVLVGGTNGKGSTVAFLESLLRAHGLSVGTYTSPHLIHLTERVRVHGKEVEEDAFGDCLERVLSLVDQGMDLSFFEVITLAAMEMFHRQNVEVAILEVGMGGRLDTTNIVEPSLSVITSIALDHCQWLGESLEDIAWEKGGISRGNTPLISGMNPALLDAAFRDRDVPGVISQLHRDFFVEGSGEMRSYSDNEVRYEELSLGLTGEHQWANAALAIRATQALIEHLEPSSVGQGTRDARLAGRLEKRDWDGVPWTLDGAHNPHAMQALVKSLEATSFARKPSVLFAAKEDKAVEEMIQRLDPYVANWVVTSVDGPGMLSASALASTVRRFSEKPVCAFEEMGEAMRTAQTQALSGGSVLVTGSLYLVGAVLRRWR